MILKKLSGIVGHDPGKNTLNFGAYLDPVADTGIIFKDSLTFGDKTSFYIFVNYLQGETAI